jgi:putative Mn2+ efflux pump MntP
MFHSSVGQRNLLWLNVKSPDMKKLELILIIGAVVGLVMKFFNVPLDSLIVSVFLITLGCLYFYLGFALFNGIRFRDIFKADSYKGLGIWRILIAIGTGIAISWLTIGFMFSILNYPMAGTFLIAGIVFAAIMIILALIRNMRDKNKFYRNIVLRCLVFIIIGVIFLFLPEQILESL